MEITRKRTMHSPVLMLSVAALTVSALLPMKSWAWGTIGHKTIAEVAADMLQPATKKRVNDLLGGQSMPSVSTWPDAIREKPEWSFTAWYHFEKIDEGKTYLENLKGLPQDEQDLGGVVMAILQAEKQFIDKNATKADKANALKFIIHFVGDIHQPLHTGRPDDKGGNKIPRTWLGFKTNLHSIWDSKIIEHGHEDIFELSTQASMEDVYAPYLYSKFKNLKLTTKQLTDVNTWVDESLAMRPDAYTYMDESEDDYTHRFVEAVDERIYVAGVRLAAMLNQIVIKEQPASARVQLSTAIEAITGAMTEFISLKPKVLPEEGTEEGGGSARYIRN